MAIDEETLKAFRGAYDIAQPSDDRVVTLDHMQEATPSTCSTTGRPATCTRSANTGATNGTTITEPR